MLEVMIIICIIGILASIAIPAMNDKTTTSKKQSSTLQIQYKVDCIEQYKFIHTGSDTIQLIDDKGNGVKCSVFENQNNVTTY